MLLLLGVRVGLSEDRKDDEAARKEQRWAENAGVGPGAHPWGSLCRELALRLDGWRARGSPEGAWGRVVPSPPLPVILGAVAQGKPPLDCSGSPRSKGSRGLGLYSRLGREEASRILHVEGRL